MLIEAASIWAKLIGTHTKDGNLEYKVSGNQHITIKWQVELIKSKPNN